jgi:phage-related protein
MLGSGAIGVGAIGSSIVYSKTISSRLLQSDILGAIDTMNQEGIWAHLFEVNVDSTTVLYLTDFHDPIIYNSTTYTPYPIAIEAVTTTAKPENKTFTVTVANIDRSIAAYLELGKILGNDVKIIWAFIRKADGEVLKGYQDIYQILSGEINEDKAAAVFEVGKYNLFKAKLPHTRWIDFRCGFVYRSINECGYGREEFKGLSQLDFKQGGDGYKNVQGWYALNLANCTSADINVLDADYLSIRIATSVNCNWNQTTKTGPFFYRKLLCSDVINVLPDFDIQVLMGGDPNEVQETEGLLICTDSDSTSNWVFIARRVLSGSTASLVIMKNLAGTETTEYSTGADNLNLRVVKSGTSFVCYAKANDAAATWVQLVSVTQANLNGVNLRVGIAFGSGASGRSSIFAGRADYFRMVSGGYRTCNRTIEDCRTRENIRRIDAAPSILHGALNL